MSTKPNEFPCLLGIDPVIARFEYEPACIGHGEHPDYPAYAEITEVVIGGVRVAPQHLNEDWISDTEIAIMKHIREAAEEQAWERQEEALAERGYP